MKDGLCRSCFLLLVVACAANIHHQRAATTDISRCNFTSTGDEFQNGFFGPTTLRSPMVVSAMLRQPLFCYYSFRGVLGQRVTIHVQSLYLGSFNNEDSSCHGGSLKLWDGLRQPGRHPYPPSVLCNNQDGGRIDFLKVSTGTSAEMEFFAESATLDTHLQATYKYVNIELESALQPKQMDHSMRPEPGSASVCTWVIVLDECGNECSIVSPGYPGTYPPNMECFYRVTSRSANSIVQLKFSGTSAGGKPREFHIRHGTSRHGYQKRGRCWDEYLELHDGDSADSPLMGRFCKSDIPDITSSGSDLYMVFASGPDLPPYGLNGFHISAYSLTQEWDQHSRRVASKTCDWIFNGSVGSVSSPDHWLPKKAICSYIFTVLSGFYLEIILNVYGLSPNCADQIEIVSDLRTIYRICDNTIPPDKQPLFTYNLTASQVVVRYKTKSGQYQAQPDRGFWMSYRQLPSPTPSNNRKRNPLKSRDDNPQRVIDPSDSGSRGSHHAEISLILVSVFTCTVLIWRTL